MSPGGIPDPTSAALHQKVVFISNVIEFLHLCILNTPGTKPHHARKQTSSFESQIIS